MSIKWIEIHATFWLEILTRAFLSVVFLELEQTAPFVRKIHLDELWLYKNPRTPSYVPTNLLWPLVFAVPTFVMSMFFLVKRNKTDLCQSLLSFSLALGLNGVITNIIKLVVGRPRPDFFYRCFPEGHADLDHVSDIGTACTGEADAIQEGRKSFPSGHASFSFCSLGFLSLWMCGKLGVFGRKRGQGWRLVLGITPMVMALMVALSRTSDYHHHWQDVLVGSVLGLFIAYLCYRQYFPRLTSPHCHLPYLMIPTVTRPVLLKGAHGEGFSSQGPLFLDPESPMEEQCVCNNGTSAELTCGPDLLTCTELTDILTMVSFPAPHYIRLRVDGTQLQCKIEAEMWGAALTFEEVHLVNNYFDMVDNHAFFPFHTTLKVLNLEKNALRFVNFPTMSDQPFLETLLLSDNEIDFMPGYSAMELDALRVLMVDRNKLCRLQPNTFAGLPRLELLDLSHNAIPKLEEEALRIPDHAAPHLLVNLSSNSIASIE